MLVLSARDVHRSFLGPPEVCYVAGIRVLSDRMRRRPEVSERRPVDNQLSMELRDRREVVCVALGVQRKKNLVDMSNVSLALANNSPKGLLKLARCASRCSSDSAASQRVIFVARSVTKPFH
jgi:hypothetical protein